MGLSAEAVRQLFERDFRLLKMEKGLHRGSTPSAWYWLERR
jgi:hypothetical protein